MIVDYTVQLMSSVTIDELENFTLTLPNSVLVTTGNLFTYCELFLYYLQYTALIILCDKDRFIA